MTRSEVIREIAIRGDIPQLEAGRFMEIFLLKMASVLVEGDSLTLDGLGSFTRIKMTSDQKRDSSGSDAIRFVPEHPTSLQGDLLFGIPTDVFASPNNLDPYFNLGINKPLIPLKGQPVVVDNIPSSPHEIRKYFDQKISIIIGSGLLERTAASREAKLAAILEESHPEPEKVPVEVEIEVPWEFGSEWKKEQGENILSASELPEGKLPATESADAIDGEADWDFGATNEDEEEVREEKALPSYMELVKTSEKATQEFSIDLSEFEKDHTEERTPEEKIPADEVGSNENTQAVELSDVLAKKIHEEEEKEAERKRNEAEFDEEFEKFRYQRVRSTAEILNIPHFLEDDTEAMLQGKKSVDNEIVEPVKPEVPELPEEPAQEPEREEEIRKSGFFRTFVWILLLLIIAGVIGYFVYAKVYRPEQEKKAKAASQSAVNPNIIERDYAFPVTYPYPPVQPAVKADTSVQTGRDTNYLSAPPKGVIEEKKTPGTGKVVKETNTKVSSAPQKVAPPAHNPAIKKEKVRNSQEAEGSYVQVMSVKIKSIAESEAAKLRSMGKKVIIQEAEIPGRGTWYRVKVSKSK
jgi:nucleoid DNA-binding protein